MTGERGSPLRLKGKEDLRPEAVNKTQQVLEELPRIKELSFRLVENPESLYLHSPEIGVFQEEVTGVNKEFPHKPVRLPISGLHAHGFFDAREAEARSLLPTSPKEAVLQLYVQIIEPRDDSEQDIFDEIEGIPEIIDSLRRRGLSAERVNFEEKRLSGVRYRLRELRRLTFNIQARRTFYNKIATPEMREGPQYSPIWGIQLSVNFADELRIDSLNLSLAEWPHSAEIKMGDINQEEVIKDLDKATDRVYKIIEGSVDAYKSSRRR